MKSESCFEPSLMMSGVAVKNHSLGVSEFAMMLDDLAPESTLWVLQEDMVKITSAPMSLWVCCRAVQDEELSREYIILTVRKIETAAHRRDMRKECSTHHRRNY